MAVSGKDKFKIIALGGCGAMGKHVVRTILNDEYVDEIIIADRDIENADVFARQCGGNVSSAQVDIADGESLAVLLAKGDIVLNTTGPYFMFGKRVLQAAIDSGCHYIDINDDQEPTTEMLELDELAKKAGITAVSGMGSSPGVANLLAVQAINELDKAEEVYTIWNIDMAAEPPEDVEQALADLKKPGYKPSGATVHGMMQLTGTVEVFDGGKFTSHKPMQEIRVDYPLLGTGYAWTIGHPEPLTLPRYFSDLNKCFNGFVTSREGVERIKSLVNRVNTGELTLEQAAMITEEGQLKNRPWDTSGPYAVPEGEIALPPLFAYAKGIKNGEPATAAVAMVAVPPGHMGAATGVPMAMGLRLLANGNITRRGVFAPEAGIDPEAFFDEIAPLCERKKQKQEKGADVIVTTRSWDGGVA